MKRQQLREQLTDNEMTSRKSAAAAAAAASTPAGQQQQQQLPDKSSDAYRRLRERNNEAVKKSRTKSRLKAQHTQERVAKLRREHEELVRQVEILKNKLDVYKDLFLKQAGAQGELELKQMDLTFLHHDDEDERDVAHLHDDDDNTMENHHYDRYHR